MHNQLACLNYTSTNLPFACAVPVALCCTWAS